MYPSEVETVLNAHPAVAQSVVVGRPVAGGNEEVVAFVELARGRTVGDRTSWPRTRRRSSRPTSVRREIRIMDALPASPTGKVLRGQLKALAQAPAGQTLLTV